ncbi:hypothetical protein PAXINDRAFT_21835 [Paxillus involutus ATCC 200175]|uniref:Uncharacterized protein n=1 Tax=Paxillus involutus ATCC 200175 TaxID=664439 RepID=A0A0C9TC79_PAXIN|nr:hypothetical protein PAXINDRAFT_21835 [Paxillus involutus ATCC 200175]
MPPSDDMDGIFQPLSGFHPPSDAFTRGMDVDDDEGMKMEEDGKEDGQDNDNDEEDGRRRRSTARRMQEEDKEGVYENEDESNSGEDEEGVYENKNEDRSDSGEEEEEVEEEEEEVEGDDGSSDEDEDEDDGDEAEATSLRRAVVRGHSLSLTPPRRPRTNREVSADPGTPPPRWNTRLPNRGCKDQDHRRKAGSTNRSPSPREHQSARRHAAQRGHGEARVARPSSSLPRNRDCGRVHVAHPSSSPLRNWGRGGVHAAHPPSSPPRHRGRGGARAAHPPSPPTRNWGHGRACAADPSPSPRRNRSRRGQRNEDTDEEDFDILDRHHHRNHAPRPPSQHRLHSIRRDAPASDDSDQGYGSNGQRRPRSRPNNNEATKCGFWPPLWRLVIDQAKLEWRVLLAVNDGFPDRNESLKAKIPDILTQCILAHKESGLKLEPSYYPTYKHELGVLTPQHSDLS